jgi:hypothetical protein
MPRISDLCLTGAHLKCPIQQPQDVEYPKCQCDCHSGTIPGTVTKEGVVDSPPRNHYVLGMIF